MAKVLVMVRVSTETQNLEEQHKEMVGFCKSEGYEEKDLIWIEEKGASAIKKNDQYQEMVKQIKDGIESDEEINAFACWSLNRAWRTESTYVELKEYFIEHNIQLIVKNPYLKLLNPDGTVNQGVELSLSLLTVLAKQEMDEKAERFRRTKSAYALQGKYTGGHTLKYGYKVEDKCFIPDPVDSVIVQKVSEKYATGKYTQYTLAKEIEELGWVRGDGKPVDFYLVSKILDFSEGYAGKPDIKNHNRVYPQLISKDLLDKIQAIKDNNKLGIRDGKNERQSVAYGLGKCYLCGGGLMQSSKRYVCTRNRKTIKDRCTNWVHVRSDVVDKLLYDVAKPLYIINNSKLDYEAKLEAEAKIKDLDTKVETAQKKLDALKSKQARINELYIDGSLNSRERQTKLDKLKAEHTTLQDSIRSWTEQRNALAELTIDKTDTPTALGQAVAALEQLPQKEVIHKYIAQFTAKPHILGTPDKRAKKPNSIQIDIVDIYGMVKTYYYVPCFYQGHNLYMRVAKEYIPLKDI